MKYKTFFTSPNSHPSKNYFDANLKRMNVDLQKEHICFKNIFSLRHSTVIFLTTSIFS